MMQLFDTHAHYDAHQFETDRAELLARLPEQGVGLVVNPGCDIPTSQQAVALATRYDYLYAAVGYHPEGCAPYQESDLAILRDLAQHPKVVAIGEIGLDYHWEDNPPKELQQQVFRAQMELAQELHLPIIVHDREAHADSLAMVKAFPTVKGVFHCFSGSVELAHELIKLGWMISFTGVLTYNNARKAVEVAEAIPLEHIMLETDAPYMAPVPFRGKRCDSSLILHTCERLAELKGISVEDCARITLENGKRFFNIP